MKSLKEIMEERWMAYWSAQPLHRQIEQFKKERKQIEDEQRSKDHFLLFLTALIVLTIIFKTIFPF